MNWEKLKSPARATFKSQFSNFFVNWDKFESTALVQDSEVPILNLQINWEKLCTNLNLTAKNKIGNLHKSGDLNMMNEIFQFLKFQEFNEWVKICFPLGKKKF